MLQVNVTRYFYLLVSNGNLTLFPTRVVAIKGFSCSHGHNEQARSQSNGTSRTHLDTFVSVFSGISISCIYENSLQRDVCKSSFLANLVPRVSPLPSCVLTDHYKTFEIRSPLMTFFSKSIYMTPPQNFWN